MAVPYPPPARTRVAMVARHPVPVACRTVLVAQGGRPRLPMTCRSSLVEGRATRYGS